MKRNSDRILVTHAGALPRSEELRELIFARADGKPHDAAALKTMLKRDVAAVVKKQIACGIDVVNDGELGKTNFTNYVRERVTGFEHREQVPGEYRIAHSISARDETEFADYFKVVGSGFRNRAPRLHLVCTSELRYIGHAALEEDLANF